MGCDVEVQTSFANTIVIWLENVIDNEWIFFAISLLDNDDQSGSKAKENEGMNNEKFMVSSRANHSILKFEF